MWLDEVWKSLEAEVCHRWFQEKLQRRTKLQTVTKKTQTIQNRTLQQWGQTQKALSLASLSSLKGDFCKETRQSKQCGFNIYTFDNLKNQINGQVGQGGEDGLVWSGLC